MKYLVCALFYCVLFGNTVTASHSRKLPLILDMVHNNPGEAPYLSKYNNPSVLKKMGYNGKVFFLFESAQLAINWDKVDKDILPLGSPDRNWVDAKSAHIDSMYNKFKKAGMQVYCQSDLLLFPKRLVEKYGLKDVMGDPQNPQTEKYLRILLREMFAQFPQLDGIVVRIGETYLHDAPFHIGDINNKTNADKCIIPLINILRDEVCVKLNKKVIFRTWYSFDTNATTYMEVDKAVEPHENLTIAVKHCEGDFHRGNPFSKVLGIGRHKQLVEAQCAREYEGKGAYPNYIAKGVIDGFEEHSDLKKQGKASSINDILKSGKMTGVWTWTRGGGWEGPYIGNEIWCDLNAYVVAQWANNPEKSEESIFNRYSTSVLGLSKNDAGLFRKMALLSTDAVIRGRRSAQYFNDIDTWWTRDEYIGFPKLPMDLSKIKTILAEKDTAVQMWKDIVKISQEIKFKDSKTTEYVTVSAKYGLSLYRIYRSVFYLSAIDKNLYPKNELKKWIDEYDASWLEYKALAKENPSCATLYSKDKALRMSGYKSADSEVNRLRKVLVAFQNKMMFGDTTRLGVPFAKDPYVIHFGGRYLMYYSIPGFTDKSGKLHGWGVGIAESNDLNQWTKIGEVNIDSTAVYESKGFAAPCALVVEGKVNLFYQTYGNNKKDAICHAWSTDGIHFIRNKTNPIFRPDGDWNCGRAIDAEVISFKGNYYLYYATRDKDYKIQMQGVAMAPGNSNFNRENWTHISKDGPILKPELPWEFKCIEAASIINKNNELYMFYGGGYNNWPQQIGVAKSIDGIHWIRIFDQPFVPNGAQGDWNSSESGHPHIFANDKGDDVLFYQGNNDGGKTWLLSSYKIAWKNGIPYIKY